MRFIDTNRNFYEPTSWMTFEDVLLRPQRSSLRSRNDSRILLDCDLTFGLPLKIPIISANMDTVTGDAMAIQMHKLGGLGILHRFYSNFAEYSLAIEKVYNECDQVAFSVGCGERWITFVNDLVEDYKPSFEKKMIVCLDVAHGHMEQSIETVKELSKLVNILIIAGNVGTGEGALDLADAGATCIKVGLGSGSVCTTRIVTGHGVPQLSAIMEVRKALDAEGLAQIGIIADGGIKNSGDIIKALAAGADAVMLGNLLAGTLETPGELFVNSLHQSYKIFRGQSSRHFLDDMGKIGVTAEGESIQVPYKGPVDEIVSELLGGIRSGLTYSGADSIYDLREKAVFMEISHHAWTESAAHALSRRI